MCRQCADSDPDDLEKHIERAPSDAEPFCALAFKIAADPFVEKLRISPCLFWND